MSDVVRSAKPLRAKFLAFALFLIVVSGGSNASAQSETCSAAPTVGPGIYASSNLFATTDGAACANGQRDVWFRYDPPSDGIATFSTCDEFGTFLDTVLSVHTACPGSVANQIGCNDQDNSCGNSNQSSVSVAVTGTSFYYVRVAGHTGLQGNFQLTITQAAPPAPSNNSCANAEVVALNTTYNRTNVSATTDGSSTCGGFNDVWFRYTPTANGNLTISTCGSAIDSILSVHSACVGNTGNQLVCDDDSGPCLGATSQVTLPVVSGTTYRIRVASFTNGATGAIQLLLTQTPPNDDCANAQVINPGTINGNTEFATTDGSTYCISPSGKDVWYSYTPTSDELALVSLCGSAFDTVLSIHSACVGAGPNQVTCDNDSYICGPQSKLGFLAKAGQTYRIRVAGNNSVFGNFTFNLDTVDCGGTVYTEDFELGLNGWTIDNAHGPSNDGLWHLTNVCSAALPGHSASTALAFMVDGTCDYTSPTATSGAIISPIFDLSGQINIPMLMSLKYYLHTSGALTTQDQIRVEASSDGFVSSIVTLATNRSLINQQLNPTGQWGTLVADLTPFDGQSNVQIRITFDTGDNAANNFPGVYIDDVTICAPPNALAGWEEYE